jgi:hypothetical protein
MTRPSTCTTRAGLALPDVPRLDVPELSVRPLDVPLLDVPELRAPLLDAPPFDAAAVEALRRLPAALRRALARRRRCRLPGLPLDVYPAAPTRRMERRSR